MNKRGLSQGIFVLIGAILLIVSLIFISTLFGKTKKISEDLTDYQICKDGNIGVVKTRLELFDWVIAEQGVKHCRTEKAVVPAGKEYETIAKKMGLCWDQYLEGEEKIFETKDNNYCAFCSVLEFEDKNKRLNELSKYLVNNKAPLSDKTYMEYLAEIKAEGDDKTRLENFELSQNVDIDTSKKYAVMFVMWEDAYPSGINAPKPLTFLGGTAVGIATAGALGLYYLGSAALCLVPFTSVLGCAASISLITVGTGAGATAGYLIGSDRSADWRARILLTEYDKEKLEQLQCTQLEGSDYLKIQEK